MEQTLPKVDYELFEAVKQAILSHPRRVDMGDALGDRDCGTVGCIAGWTCLIKLSMVDESEEEVRVAIPTTVLDSAQAFLGLTLGEADDLFYTGLSTGARIFPGLRSIDDALLKCKSGTPEYAALVARAIDVAVAQLKEQGR